MPSGTLFVCTFSIFRFSTSDGCSTNLAAVRVLGVVMPEKKNVVCLSHSSNLVGKIAETSAALSHSFVGYVA